ncbi:conserved hypothetical protein [Methylocella silvestris BL2]|uniref:Uncharacterized protein n=1 Tax=Methylocella silvestris (strain DSM 15510 / CIP 108128 / LMG 27833 / NCIMB 13906 / BL2) TaxID=395965 RepID=B8EQ08_METSB|nr:hypothetical protein [Methylocella silvestris]ACK51498.1 conserved hypothetical protein [Methylocella silvestris BL2]
MKLNRLIALSLACSMSFAPMAFAAGLEGLQFEKEVTMKMKSGKSVTIKLAKMNGQMMAIVPMEDLNELLMRAEGHDMSTYN